MDRVLSQFISITAVIVLYKKSPAESQAFTSFDRILCGEPSLSTRFRLVIYDNSPPTVPASLPPTVYQLEYVHDAKNGGLSTAFNYALEQASARGSEWLLLLDQDTTLTRGYLDELLDAIALHNNDHHVAAIVPLIESNGLIYSPEETFSYHLRHQFPFIRYFRVSADTSGIQSRLLNAYNSGAALRVSALRKIGGFPVDFKLDYLDFAVFHLLQKQGFVIFVLRSQLHQELSHRNLDEVPLSRHTSVLLSQSLFLSRYATWLDRMLFRLWLLRMSRHYRMWCKDPRVWKGMVRQALGKWRLPETGQTQ